MKSDVANSVRDLFARICREFRMTVSRTNPRRLKCQDRDVMDEEEARKKRTLWIQTMTQRKHYFVTVKSSVIQLTRHCTNTTPRSFQCPDLSFRLRERSHELTHVSHVARRIGARDRSHPIFELLDTRKSVQSTLYQTSRAHESTIVYERHIALRNKDISWYCLRASLHHCVWYATDCQNDKKGMTDRTDKEISVQFSFIEDSSSSTRNPDRIANDVEVFKAHCKESNFRSVVALRQTGQIYQSRIVLQLFRRE